MVCVDQRGILGTFTIVVFLSLLHPSSSSEQKLTVPPNAVCACPGEVLTYTCIAVGPGRTVWTGSAFDCPSSQNQIVFRHSEFESQSVKRCTDGYVVGKPLFDNNGTFTSQLNVTINAGQSNKVVQCRATSNTIGTSTISVISEPYPPPTSIQLASIHNGELVFTWNAVNNCPSISYLMLATDGCFTCPNSTNTTSANCTTAGLSLTNDVTNCTFSVQSEVCGYISNLSDTILITLKVPDAPYIKVVPSYINETQSLTSFQIFIQETDLFNFVSGSSTYYNISYSTNMITKVSVVPTCNGDICNYSFEPTLCSEDIRITVSAINELGEGLSTETVIIGCLNNFVRVGFDPLTSTLTCEFLNQFTTTAEKTCDVTYSMCQQGPDMTASSNPTYDATVSVTLEIESSTQSLCYIVNATSGDFITEVNGIYNLSSPMDKTHGQIHIIPAVVTPLVILLGVMVGVVGVVVVIIKIVKNKKPNNLPPDHEEVDMDKHSLYFKSVVRGYHVYRKHWTPNVGDILSTKRQPWNCHDRGAVAVIKSKVVGHMPGTIAKYCSTFIKRKGKIRCKITSKPRDQKISMNVKKKVRLEVPCIYKFSADDEENLQNIKEVLENLKTPLAEQVNDW